jgi:hypothetical protein
MGREWAGGGQFTSNLGPGGSHHAERRVSKKVRGAQAQGNQQGELARGINKEYCVNVANKRFVFRL